MRLAPKLCIALILHVCKCIGTWDVVSLSKNRAAKKGLITVLDSYALCQRL